MGTALARKELGQFWTPEPIAKLMARWSCAGRPWRVLLDPAVGPGVFLREALSLQGLAGSQGREAVAYDVDASFQDGIEQLDGARGCRIDFRCEDFMVARAPEADAILCNPPYMKHHFVREKDRVFSELEELTGTVLPRTISLHALFLMKALSLLAPGGRLAFIMPSEFMNADYGVAVKRFLLASGMLRGIAAFDRDHLVFPGALTTACIILAERDQARQEAPILIARVSCVQDLEAFIHSLHNATLSADEASQNRCGLQSGNWRSGSALDPATKWHRYYDAPRIEPASDHIPLRSIGRCSRGIATGANSFFLLRPSDVKRIGLEEAELVRCIGRANDLRNDTLTLEQFHDLMADDKPTLLLSLRGREPSRAAKSYIKKGEELGLHARYLTRARVRWYDVETRETPDMFVSVFFRGKPKVILNEAKVVSLTAFHGLYLDPLMSHMAPALARYLNSPAGNEALLSHRREYGNGLLKLEPRDVESASIPRSLLQP